MSKFFSEKFKDLKPYVPGEQPKERSYVKLNTNESPFPPSPRATAAAAREAARLELYSDPDSSVLKEKLAQTLGVGRDEVFVSNGSDEVLNFAFLSFCDERHPAAFADVTYGFYPVFARLYGIPYTEIPLKEDFSIDVSDYLGIGKTVFIANPNAPTGIQLSVDEIEQIVSSNRQNVVVIDEAYVDFGAESCIPLIKKYDNLLVTGTFSKSRSMAGARLGFGVACPALIADLETVKYSTNPYNVNRMTAAAGVGALEDEEYTKENCKKIVENRAYTAQRLKALGFTLTDSKANFLFAASDRIGGEELYLKLKQRGVLIRHFSSERLKNYNRITVGTKEQMDILLRNIEEIIGEQQ